MSRYVVTRVLSSLVILWIVSLVSFLLMNLLPGDPSFGIGASNRPRSRWPPSAIACTSTIR